MTFKITSDLIPTSSRVLQKLGLLTTVSPVAQRLKRLPGMRETWIRSLGWEDPLEKEMATHSSTLAWRIPWREEPGRLLVHGVAKSRTRLGDFTFTFDYPISLHKLVGWLVSGVPGYSLHGILQARVLEWDAISFSRGSSQPRDQTRVSCIGGRRFNL